MSPLQQQTPEPDAVQDWSVRYAAFLAEYSALLEQEGVALEEFRTF
jgi:hypothetical protein